jgi:hypothetical protein
VNPTRRIAELQRRYDAFERHLPLTAGPPELGEAVQFRSNRTRPVHRWFRFKEGFSADLFGALGLSASAMQNDDSVFLDPFCGCGTTLVAGDLQEKWQSRRVGFEVNPFLAFVAHVKASWRAFDPARLSALATAVLAEPLRVDIDPTSWPSLSSFHNESLIPPERVSALVDAVDRIEAVAAPERDLLLLGVAAAVERLAFFRRDGRALRILRTDAELKPRRQASTDEVLRRTWARFFEDVQALNGKATHPVGESVVLCGDGRSLQLLADLHIRDQDVGFIAYSPPYLNHIDYTEVYKLELWLLRHIEKADEMLDLRKRTLRSHASIGVEHVDAELPESLRTCVELAASIVGSAGTKWHAAFPRLIRAYLADMRTALERQFALLEDGGRAVCVIGNSAHGSKDHRVPLAIDLFIAALAEDIGFQVERVVIARQLRRRDHLNWFLRETAIVLRRPRQHA